MASVADKLKRIEGDPKLTELRMKLPTFTSNYQLAVWLVTSSVNAWFEEYTEHFMRWDRHSPPPDLKRTLLLMSMHRYQPVYYYRELNPCKYDWTPATHAVRFMGEVIRSDREEGGPCRWAQEKNVNVVYSQAWEVFMYLRDAWLRGDSKSKGGKVSSTWRVPTGQIISAGCKGAYFV